MTVNAITDTKKGEQGLRLLIFILPVEITDMLYSGGRGFPCLIDDVMNWHNGFGEFGEFGETTLPLPSPPSLPTPSTSSGGAS